MVFYCRNFSYRCCYNHFRNAIIFQCASSIRTKYSSANWIHCFFHWQYFLDFKHCISGNSNYLGSQQIFRHQSTGAIVQDMDGLDEFNFRDLHGTCIFWHRLHGVFIASNHSSANLDFMDVHAVRIWRQCSLLVSFSVFWPTTDGSRSAYHYRNFYSVKNQIGEPFANNAVLRPVAEIL